MTKNMHTTTRASRTRITVLPGDLKGKPSLESRILEMLLESAGTMLPEYKESRRSTSDIMLDTRYKTTRSVAAVVPIQEFRRAI